MLAGAPMLRGINPILSPDLLHALRAMGHGDTIVIADANFPAESNSKRLIRLDGLQATDVLRAILEVLPIEDRDDAPASVMQTAEDRKDAPEVFAAFQQLLDEFTDYKISLSYVDRHHFYENAKKAYAVIQTGETRHYGNICLMKGVLPE